MNTKLAIIIFSLIVLLSNSIYAQEFGYGTIIDSIENSAIPEIEPTDLPKIR